jgi:hypothetical protein
MKADTLSHADGEAKSIPTPVITRKITLPLVLINKSMPMNIPIRLANSQQKEAPQ